MMPVVFQAEPDPSSEALGEAAALAPENPFYTPAYAAAMGLAGEQPWMLALRDGGRCLAACTGFLKGGRLTRWLDVPSLPTLGENAPAFWDGLLRFARRSGITHLGVNTYASIEGAIPAVPSPSRTAERTEYVIRLDQGDLWRSVRQHHRRLIKRANQAGLRVSSSSSEADCPDLCRLIADSMQRRERRGEAVPADRSADRFAPLLRCGSAVLFRTLREDRVLSSAMLLLSDRGAYYHSSGTSTEGMELGASHLLIYEAARYFQERGNEVFNLGGVSGCNPGLQAFKMGFGAAPRSLAAVEFDLETGLRRGLRSALSRLRGTWPGLVRGGVNGA